MSKLEILVNDGSPIGVTSKSITGEDGRIGVGGSELALLTMCEAWHKEGHEVVLYNSPDMSNGSAFQQKGIDDFKAGDEHEYVIVFRSPNHRIKDMKAKRIIWWSTDQATIGSFKDFSKEVDKIVTISKFHSDHFKNIYGISNTVSIDLPVRTWEYHDDIEKVQKRCIFTSVPDRGLMPLNAAWARIVRDVPDASLVITSDWRLWSPYIDESGVRPYRLAFAHQPNVTYLSAVNRKRLVEEQMKATLHLYPCI
jgi:glycosyltransferase involved in cell wall biosynthesis